MIKNAPSVNSSSDVTTLPGESEKVSRHQTESSEGRNNPFPRVQFANKSFSSVAAQVAVEAGLFQRSDDVDILACQAANFLIQLRHRQQVFFGSELAPAPFEICVRRDLVTWRDQVIDDCSKSYSRTYPFRSFFKLTETAEYSGATDQKNQTKKPSEVPVELEVAAVQLNRVVNVKPSFVGCAAIAHSCSDLFFGRRGRRFGRGVPKRRNLGFVFDFVITHESSLLFGWVLGSPKIVACELSPMPPVCGSQSPRALTLNKPDGAAL